MPINIKNADTDRLARELADLTGESLTDAITAAIQERLERERERRARRRGLQQVLRIRERYTALPTLDQRRADEILGYDDYGLPGA